MPVWTGLLAVDVGLVPGPALCPGAGAAERPQEILYYKNLQIFGSHSKQNTRIESL